VAIRSIKFGWIFGIARLWPNGSGTGPLESQARQWRPWAKYRTVCEVSQSLDARIANAVTFSLKEKADEFRRRLSS